MADLDKDTPPSQVAPSEFGYAVLTRDNTEIGRYKLSAVDVIYLTVCCETEDPWPYLACWGIIQRFAQELRGRPQQNGLARLINSFSAPLNPLYASRTNPNPNMALCQCATLGEGYRHIPHNSIITMDQLMREVVPDGSDNQPDSIVGMPFPPTNLGVWNKTMCSNGAFRARQVSNPGRRAQFRANFAKMRKILRGGAQEETWRSISPNVRACVYKFVQARVGNPLPGYDNWAACDVERWTNRPKLSLSTLDPSRVAAELTRVQSLPGENPVQFGVNSNCFLYKTVLLQGEQVHMECGIKSSVDQAVPIGHFGREGSEERAGALRRAMASVSGGSVRTDSHGLATSNEVQNIERTELPSGDDLYRAIEGWARGICPTLDENLGTGRKA